MPKIVSCTGCGAEKAHMAKGYCLPCYGKMRYQIPKVRSAIKANAKKRLTPELREEINSARRTPEGRAKCQAYRARPGVSEKQRELRNAPERLKHQKEYWQEYSHRPGVKERISKYKKEHDNLPEVRLARKQRLKTYYQRPEFKKAHSRIQRRRRARLEQVIEIFTEEEWTVKLESTNGYCPRCAGYIGIDNLTLDHIYPVSLAFDDWQETGVKRVYTIEDVQPLCGPCNSSKKLKQTEYLIVKELK